MKSYRHVIHEVNFVNLVEHVSVADSPLNEQANCVCGCEGYARNQKGFVADLQPRRPDRKLARQQIHCRWDQARQAEEVIFHADILREWVRQILSNRIFF